jgi:hypothetical protein
VYDYNKQASIFIQPVERYEQVKSLEVKQQANVWIRCLLPGRKLQPITQVPDLSLAQALTLSSTPLH